MVQHLMRQHEKYQTICDYALTISHDMGVINDIKRCETPMQKLQEIIYPEWDLSKELQHSRKWVLFFRIVLFIFSLTYDKI